MIYDISLPISPEMVVWPSDPRVERADFGDEVRVSRWTLGSHTGTHVDAPRHFLPGGKTLEQLDPAAMLGLCRVLDFPEASVITANLLTARDLTGVERVLFRTRNSQEWARGQRDFNPEYVALAPDAAEMLVKLGIKLVGTDGLSIEGYAGDGTVHRLLLGAGIVLLEGANLANVPAGEYQLICAPLLLDGADGAPARAWLVEG